MAINTEKLNEFLGKAIVDFGATFHAALVRVGGQARTVQRVRRRRPSNSGGTG
jgi:hypothetical protein